MQIHKTYNPSRYYTSFCSIPETNFLQKVHYFEKHEQNINSLDEVERYKIYKEYLSSLFHIRAYEKFISYSDQVIQMSLNQELEASLEFFYLILYRKVIAYNMRGMYQNTDHLCRQMFRMNQPYDVTKYFIRANKRIIRSHQQFMRRAIVLSLSLAVSIYFIEIIIVSAFYPRLSYVFNIFVLVLLAISFGSLLVSELYSTQKAKSKLVAILTEKIK